MANVCGTLGANTGKPQCDVALGYIKYPLLTQGREFTESELLDSNSFKTALRAAMLEVRGTANKVYPWPVINEAERTTGDPTTGSMADGLEVTLLDPTPKQTLRNGKVGPAQNQAMCAFNGFNGRFYFVDSFNRLVYKIKDNNGGKGFALGDLYTTPPEPGNTASINAVNTRLSFASADEFKLGAIGLLQRDFNVADLINLEDIQIVEKAAQASNVFTIGGKGVYSGADIYTAYKTALNNTARWVMKRLDTGATLAATGIATDDTNKGWDLTMDNTVYTGLPSGTKISINIADPATLDAAGVSGIEGVQIIYTKP